MNPADLSSPEKSESAAIVPAPTPLQEENTSSTTERRKDGEDVDKDVAVRQDVVDAVSEPLDGCGSVGEDSLLSNEASAGDSEPVDAETSMPVVDVESVEASVVLGDGSERIGRERSEQKKNPVILAEPAKRNEIVHRPATIKKVELAANLRAEGASWDEVSQVMKRKSTSTVRKIPGLYPDLWTPAYKRAVQRVMTRGHSEAFLTLRRRLKDSDGRVSVQAARGILQHIERMTAKVVKHVGKIEHEHSVRRDGLQDVGFGGLEDLREQLVG